jgi:hypothetical protein
MEDGTQRHIKKTQQILNLTDEDEIPPPRPKKSKARKQSKKKATVIDSGDSSSDDQISSKRKPTKTNLAASLQVDTDIEEIPNPKESPEEELGEL